MPTASDLQSESMFDSLRVVVSSALLVRSLEPNPKERNSWHPHKETEGLDVSIRSVDDRARLLELTVESNDPAWFPGWIKWSYAYRKSTETQGGESVDSLDRTSDDGESLRLLVHPARYDDETGEIRKDFRVATLDLQPTLDRLTDPGDYKFEIVVSDVTDGGKPEELQRFLSCLRIVHPASASFQSLPGIYHEDGWSPNPADATHFSNRPFFERFLGGFDDIFAEINSIIAQVDNLFGPHTTWSEFLHWLGRWVVLALDDNWPQMKQRKLISEAVELYRWRGTRKGLSRFLEIYTGCCPDINDQPCQGMRLGPDAILGTEATTLGDIRAHTFVVTLAVPNPGEINEDLVHEIIQSQKPAHTAYSLSIVRSASGEQWNSTGATYAS